MNHFLADDEQSREYFGDGAIAQTETGSEDEILNTKRVDFTCSCGFHNVNAEAFWRAGKWSLPCADCPKTTRRESV